MSVYTMQDWQKDGTFRAADGQEISEEIYNEMFNVLPPLRLYESGYDAGFRVSEPYMHDENGKPLYRAFGKKNGKYYYIGLR